MFAVKGIYNGKSVVVKEHIPMLVNEQCEVIVTFLSPNSTSNKNKHADDSVRKEAFDFIANFPKKSLPSNFDYKLELEKAIREKYDSID